MRILIDARAIQDHFPGIGRYVFNLIDALAPQLEGELLALVDENVVNNRYDLGHLARHANVQLITTEIPIFSWRSQTALPRLIRRLAPDVAHFPYNVRPLRVGLPSVLTLYDVIPRRFPQYYPRLTRWKIEGIQRAAIRASAAFVAISQSTADDFVEFYGVSTEKIIVTPLAPDPIFHPRPRAELDAFRQRQNLPEDYFLYLGSNKPHKNLPRLIRAWAKASDKLKVKSDKLKVKSDKLKVKSDKLKVKSDKLKVKGGKLIIAGHWDERYPQAKELAAALGVTDSVRFLGPVSGPDLPLLYAAATAFIFPSLYEGFGLPVLEAMASQVAVACSRAPGLTEVAGEAALTFDPHSVEEMADALRRLGTDASERAHLTRLGIARASAFSWERTARLTLRAYQKALA